MMLRGLILICHLRCEHQPPSVPPSDVCVQQKHLLVTEMFPNERQQVKQIIVNIIQDRRASISKARLIYYIIAECKSNILNLMRTKTDICCVMLL